eukprot:12682209-Ditylum_brightwellii.AAC.1
MFVLTLEANDFNQITLWVDAAFAVRQDMQSHTGGTMMVGKGAVFSTFTKQKLNTRSSMEAELVRMNNIMPWTFWMQYFLEAQ